MTNDIRSPCLLRPLRGPRRAFLQHTANGFGLVALSALAADTAEHTAASAVGRNVRWGSCLMPTTDVLGARS